MEQRTARSEMRFSLLYLVSVFVYLMVRGIGVAMKHETFAFTLGVLCFGIFTWFCMWMVLKNYSPFLISCAFVCYAAGMVFRFLDQFDLWYPINYPRIHGHWTLLPILAVASYLFVAFALLWKHTSHPIVAVAFLIFSAFVIATQECSVHCEAPAAHFLELLRDLSGLAAYMSLMFFMVAHCVRCRDVVRAGKAGKAA